jgi:hypothetical protein
LGGSALRSADSFAVVVAASANAVRAIRFAAALAGRERGDFEFVAGCEAAHVATAAGDFFLRSCHGSIPLKL